MAQDCFKTIKSLSEGSYTAKRSRFLAFALPVATTEEVKIHVAAYRKKFFDARHICWAYMLGVERLIFRANDDGEPSSTAGKPILGQINSNELTDILIIVVRYFGGVELGTSGLIAAYRAAAAAAINAAEIINTTVDEEITISFDYALLNEVLKIVREESAEIITRNYDTTCSVTLRTRQSLMPRLRERLSMTCGRLVG
ncbi:MAG: YigZ family protein [Tannerella sp.]|jgi:uncharacterized YigZ family protein|nr:YigZ family protein [Tannerella sp.]